MTPITLSLTNHNRYDLLLESFAQVLDDDRIGEIIISDDKSDLKYFDKILAYCQGKQKIRLFRNSQTEDVYKNKYRSAVYASNEWCILFDSDNVITPKYLDVLEKLEPWDKHTVYSPDFAKPEFDFRHISGKMIDRTNVSKFFKEKRFDCLINLMNCFINKEEYLKVFDPHVEPVAADSAYFNYTWLSAGNKFYVVPGLEYEHRIHNGSHYVQNIGRSNVMHAKVMDMLKNMK